MVSCSVSFSSSSFPGTPSPGLPEQEIVMGSVCPTYRGSNSYGLYGDLGSLALIYMISLTSVTEGKWSFVGALK